MGEIMVNIEIFMWTIYWCAVSSTSKCLEYASILQYSRNRFQKQCWTHRGWWFVQLTCWKVKENLKDQIKVSALGSQEVWLACAWLPQQSWGPFLNVRILPNLRNIDNLYHSTKMFNPTWFKLIVSSEFIKIKQKQKAWAVDNGLRVHEVKWNFSFLVSLHLICYVLLQRGSGDKLMMIASQTLVVRLHPVSKGSNIIPSHHDPFPWSCL